VNLSTETVQQLTEMGFVAVGNGMFAEAETIFAGVAAARPDSELPLIAQGINQMNAGKVSDAIHTLQAAVQKNPESAMAMSCLGVALKLAGLSAASEDVCQQVVQENRHAEAVALAKSLLEN